MAVVGGAVAEVAVDDDVDDVELTGDDVTELAELGGDEVACVDVAWDVSTTEVAVVVGLSNGSSSPAVAPFPPIAESLIAESPIAESSIPAITSTPPASTTSLGGAASV